MRTMLRIHIDAVAGSEAQKAGGFQKAVGAFVERFKPEAAYFMADNGMRTGLFFFDLQASEHLPVIAEAFFDLGCTIDLTPCMTLEELQRGLAAAGL